MHACLSINLRSPLKYTQLPKPNLRRKSKWLTIKELVKEALAYPFLAKFCFGFLALTIDSIDSEMCFVYDH